MDNEYEALRQARMAQMQQGRGDEQKRQQMEDMTNSMLGQLLDQSARARLNNVALVNPTKAKQVEGMLMNMARQGQVVTPVKIIKIFNSMVRVNLRYFRTFFEKVEKSEKYAIFSKCALCPCAIYWHHL